MDVAAVTLLVGAGLAVVPGWVGWLLGRATGRTHEDATGTAGHELTAR